MSKRCRQPESVGRSVPLLDVCSQEARAGDAVGYAGATWFEGIGSVPDVLAVKDDAAAVISEELRRRTNPSD